MNRRTIAYACLFAAAVAAAGVADGTQSGRWRPLRPLDGSVERLQTLPLSVGQWIGEDAALSADDFARAGVAGAVFRKYRNRETDDTVGLLVLVGRSGPISAHTPDVCYGGSGYELLGGVTPVTAKSGTRQTVCQTLRLRPPVTRPGLEMEVTWGWITADGVSSSATPRLSYAGLDVLYKFYVLRDRRPTDVVGANDPGLLFVADFIPHLEALVERVPEPGR